eukprot:PRCOL_00001367-RA
MRCGAAPSADGGIDAPAARGAPAGAGVPLGSAPPLPWLPGGPAACLQSIASGATLWVGSAVFAVSFATLIFSGPGAPDDALAEGIGVVLFSSAVSAVVVASASSMPVVAEVQDGPSALFGLIAADIFSGGLPQELMLPTLEVALALTSIVSGAASVAVGRLQLGTAVRFLPQPVVGGFLAGTGYVLACGGWKVLTGEPVSLAGVEDALANPTDVYATLLPGVAFGALLTYATKRSQEFYIIPACIASSTAAYFGGMFLFGLEPQAVMDHGWLLGPFEGVGDGPFPFKPLALDPLRLLRVDYDYVLDQLPRVATIASLSVLGVLLNVSAIEVALDRDSNVRSELQAAGFASILSGLGGGVVNFHSLSSTSLAKSMGSRSRLEGLTVGACYLIALTVGMPWLAFAPRALTGGLLLFLAFAFLYDWVLTGWLRMPRDEYAVVVTILFAIAAFGYLAGVAIGLLAAAAIFVADYSKVPIVRASFNLSEEEGVRSSASYSFAQRRAIGARGRQAYVVVLQGFIFFGTAFNLLSELREVAQSAANAAAEGMADAATPSAVDDTGAPASEGRRDAEDGSARSAPQPLRFVILDFSYVVGVDGSAVSVFNKLRSFAEASGITLVLSGIDSARDDLRELSAVTTRGEMVSQGLVERAKGASLDETEGESGIGAADFAVRVDSFDDALREVEAALLNQVPAEEWAEVDAANANTRGGGADEGAGTGAAVDSADASVGAGAGASSTASRDGSASAGAAIQGKLFQGRTGRVESFEDVVTLVCRDRGRSGELFPEDDSILVPGAGQPPHEAESAHALDEDFFRACWKPFVFEEGDVVCRRGDVADRLYYIESGAWTASAPGGLLYPIENDFVGAVGFYRSAYSGTVRFADLSVSRRGVAWVLDADAVEALELQAPELAAAFHRVMASHLADTLVSRSRLVAQYYRRSMPRIAGSEDSDGDNAGSDSDDGARVGSDTPAVDGREYDGYNTASESG